MGGFAVIPVSEPTEERGFDESILRLLPFVGVPAHRRGMKRRLSFTRIRKWIPAFAGMTIKSEGQNHYPALGGAHWDITSPWRLFNTPEEQAFDDRGDGLHRGDDGIDRAARHLLQPPSRPRRRRRPPGHRPGRPAGRHPVPKRRGRRQGRRKARGRVARAATPARSLCAPGAGSRGFGGTPPPAPARSRPGRSRSPGCSGTAPSRPRSPRASSRLRFARAGA